MSDEIKELTDKVEELALIVEGMSETLHEIKDMPKIIKQIQEARRQRYELFDQHLDRLEAEIEHPVMRMKKTEAVVLQDPN